MGTDKLLDISNKNFKYVRDSGFYKFKYMDSWCLEYSKFLKNEVNVKQSKRNSSQRTYKSYSKGAIIYAKLGINVGNEFSGNHFCIVLNKNDTIFNPILTVVPLTSSSSKFNVKIEEEILQLATKILYKQAKIIADKLIHHVDEINKSENPNDPHLLKVNKELQEESEQIFKVYDRYERYKNKSTYANILNITSISKERITKINSYDPIGEMVYSENTINKIDKSIKNRFLN